MDIDMYSIKNWNEIYENNRTREMKTLGWIPIPNKLDGDGYTEMMMEPDGAAIYGAWIACVHLAGRCDPRGTLLRSCGKPHDSVSIARITRMPVKTIERMLTFCTNNLNWLIYNAPQEGAEIPQEGAGISQEGAQNRTEQNRTELNILNNFSDQAEEIYSLYPTRDVLNENRSTGKCSKDREKIIRLLKSGSPVKAAVEFYIADCRKSKVFLKNFGTLLNALPDIPEPEPVKKVPAWRELSLEEKKYAYQGMTPNGYVEPPPPPPRINPMANHQHYDEKTATIAQLFPDEKNRPNCKGLDPNVARLRDIYPEDWKPKEATDL